jgi:hypothetical protein
MNAPIPAPLFVLATRPKHTFDNDKRILVDPNPALGRGSQIERPCTRCGLIKITALDDTKDPRQWRLPGETAQRLDDPGCVSDEEMLGRTTK